MVENFNVLGKQWIEASHGFDLSMIANYAASWYASHPEQPFVRTPSSFGRLAVSDAIVDAFSGSEKTAITLPDWTSDLFEFHAKQTPYWIYPLQR